MALAAARHDHTAVLDAALATAMVVTEAPEAAWHYRPSLSDSAVAATWAIALALAADRRHSPQLFPARRRLPRS